MIRRLKSGIPVSQRNETDARTRATVEAILADIDERGELAVRALSEQFDNWSPP